MASARAGSRVYWPAAAMVSAMSGVVVLSNALLDAAVYWFLLAMTLGFGCLAWAYREASHTSARTVLIVAVALHLIGLLGVPLFEDDHYRYLWDGYRFVESGNPYGVPPQAFFDDPSVPETMRPALDGINYPAVPTIYGPVMQMLFGAGYLVAPGAFWPIRLALVLANLGLIALLLRTASPRAVLLYAWNPLVFKEVALTGHPDALLALPLLLAWQWRHAGGLWIGTAVKGALFGVALAIKISAIPAMAWLLWRRRYGAIPLAFVTLLLLYLPFASLAGDLPGFVAFARDWQFNAAAFAWASALLGPLPAKAVCAVIAVAAMFLIQWRARADEACPPWHRVFGILLLCSPAINAWYLLWLLPFAVHGRDLWPWVASWALCLSYVTGLNTAREDVAAFALLPWAQALEWGLIALALAFDVWRRYSTSSKAGADIRLFESRRAATSVRKLNPNESEESR
jgi:alpha-1,6-mannosyltransferase